MQTNQGRKEGRSVKLGLCASLLAPSSIAWLVELSGELGMGPFAHLVRIPASNTSSLFHRPLTIGRKERRMETRCTLWGCIAVLKVGLKSIEELLSESNIYENSFKIGPGQWTQCSGHHISSALCSYKYNYIYSLFVSSDWSSNSDDVLLYIYTSKPTFSDYHSLPCCKWCYKCHSKSLKQYQCNWSHKMLIWC